MFGLLPLVAQDDKVEIVMWASGAYETHFKSCHTERRTASVAVRSRRTCGFFAAGGSVPRHASNRREKNIYIFPLRNR